MRIKSKVFIIIKLLEETGVLVKRKKDFILHNVAGEYLLVPIGSQVMNLNGLITLNSTAAFVWEMLAEDCSENEIAGAVSEKFNINIASAGRDVNAFLDEIRDMGLLENDSSSR